MESTGIKSSTAEIPAIISSAKSIKRVRRPLSDSASPLRRSVRLKEVSSSPQEIEDRSELMQERTVDPCKSEGMETTEDHVSGISDYERLRIARIHENKARMASLGIDRSIKELQDIFSTKRMHHVKPDLSTPCRRSDRLRGRPCEFGCLTSPDRCGSKRRDSTDDPIFWFSCHVCRQKKMCDKEECRHCGDRDTNQRCIGKTECSACRSSIGVLCSACLKVRYGEEMEDVTKNKDWMCPHCIEEKGINPYWICNSSVCLKKRKMGPTGITIYHAREQGYQSVAHLIMDILKHEEDFS